MFKTQSSKFARIRVIRVIRSALLVVDEWISRQVDRFTSWQVNCSDKPQL